MVLSFTLAGCYEAKIPMKEKADKFAPELLGHWIEVMPAGGAADPLKSSTPSEIVIDAGGPEEYSIRHQNSMGEVSRFRAFIVMVNDVPFLNAQVTEGEADMVGKYFFFRYAINEGRLELRMVSDRFIKQQFATSEELYNFIRENLENAKLCEDAVLFKTAP